MTDLDDWRTAIERGRAEKDAYLADHPQSPLPPDERASFDGLAYYEPDPDYRYVLELHEHDDPERITVETTTGGSDEYLGVGRFRFDLHGAERTLVAYRRPDGDQNLWLPFRDATSGETTYDAGRYLDLDAERDREGERWVVDFNEAYSPFCAYSDAYECPLVPPTNWLEASVEAGEMYPY
ncbi:MAG: DUF1684 domain-containing protein [Haloferacaceae archaeon]